MPFGPPAAFRAVRLSQRLFHLSFQPLDLDEMFWIERQRRIVTI